MDVVKYSVIGFSALFGFFLFQCSYYLRRLNFFIVVSYIAIILLIAGLILEYYNTFNFYPGLTLLAMSNSAIYLLYFEILNRFFYQMNGYYPWHSEDDLFIYSSKKKSGKFVNETQPGKQNKWSKFFYIFLLDMGWMVTHVTFFILALLYGKR